MLPTNKNFSLPISNVDWDDLGKSLARAPQIIKQRVYEEITNTSKYSANDPDYELKQLLEQVTSYEKQYEILKSTVYRYKVSVTEFLTHFLKVAQSFYDISYDEPKDNIMHELTITLISKIKQDQVEIGRQVEDFYERMNKLLTQIIKFVKIIHKAIKERAYIELDYQKYMQESDRLNNKKDLNLKEHKRLAEIHNKLEDSKERLELFNQNMRLELPAVKIINDNITRNISTIIFYQIHDFHAQLYSIVDNLNRFENNDKNFDVFIGEVKLNQKNILAKIEKLKITRYHRASIDDLQYRLQQQQNIGLALYTFEGIREGDLKFEKGDSIKVLQENVDGWWRGVNVKDDTIGLFPYNYFKYNHDNETLK